MFLKNHAQLQILRGWVPFFDKFHGVFRSKSRIYHLASLPSQTKPSGLKSSRDKWNLPSEASHIVAYQSKESKPSTAKQQNQDKQPNQPNQTKVKQASKPSKITSIASSSQTRASKLNTRNTTKRRWKASFGWVSGVQPREPRKSTKQINPK